MAILAPASSSCFFASSASSFETPSLNFFGNPSMSSFASFSARLVNALTALITAILALLGTSSITTSNSVFSSTAGAASAAAPPGAATAATGAKDAAETPSLSWRKSTRTFASSRVSPAIASPRFVIFSGASTAETTTRARRVAVVARWKMLGNWMEGLAERCVG